MTDRTEEFRGAVKVFRPTIAASEAANTAPGSGRRSHASSVPPPRAETSEFLQLAASVAVGFEGTSKLVSTFLRLLVSGRLGGCG